MRAAEVFGDVPVVGDVAEICAVHSSCRTRARASLKVGSGLGYQRTPSSTGPRSTASWLAHRFTREERASSAKDREGELLVPANTAPWDDVRDRLNQQLRGWANYFAYGTRLMAYRAVDNHVYAAVRGFLTRRHKVPTRGTRHFSGKIVFEELGVLRLRRLHIGAPPTATR